MIKGFAIFAVASASFISAAQAAPFAISKSPTQRYRDHVQRESNFEIRKTDKGFWQYRLKNPVLCADTFKSKDGADLWYCPSKGVVPKSEAEAMNKFLQSWQPPEP